MAPSVLYLQSLQSTFYTVLAPEGGDLNFKECYILGLCSDA